MAAAAFTAVSLGLPGSLSPSQAFTACGGSKEEVRPLQPPAHLLPLGREGLPSCCVRPQFGHGCSGRLGKRRQDLRAQSRLRVK
eukprot:CAMPEP_0117695484 /NCGR_PEP_ID=MMETSP0804-20121206/28163_1 /TAXON_ID=1074897 /ORGANISM="Tetraselmis astigmatica, Strain CCMP880" /LENGTH=83 /DNA_ID=CAMNT_0005509557 /DNA_START=187 /DNA_END=438 /DNA_ORIENTATION=+